MRVRKLATLLALVSASFTGTPASAQNAPAWQLVHRAKDTVAGAELRVFKAGARELQIEVEDPLVLVRKSVRPSGIEVFLSAGSERINIAMAPGALTVSGPAGTARVSATTREEAGKAKGMLAQSSAVGRATALLARLSVKKDSPLYQALLSTRALLESASGQRAAAEELADWSHGLKERPALRRISMEIDQQGPGDCWNLYALEAIAAYIQYEGCMAEEPWWDIIGMTLCAFIYDLRATGAFVWWLNCIGIFPVS
jgi:hypothetical protein